MDGGSPARFPSQLFQLDIPEFDGEDDTARALIPFAFLPARMLPFSPLRMRLPAPVLTVHPNPMVAVVASQELSNVDGEEDESEDEADSDASPPS
jgi:hypothetical protein